MPKLYDISVPLDNQTVTWPGDPGVEIRKHIDVEAGDPATVRHLSFGAHTGTHVDAFCHFIAGHRALSEMDLAPYIGLAKVIEIQNPAVITREELLQTDWADFEQQPQFDGHKRVLFKTGNSSTPWYHEPFKEHFCHIHPDAADFLAEQRVSLVGVDYLSVEGYHTESLYGKDYGSEKYAAHAPTHFRLMYADIYILEGLYLADIAPGWYELLCLPLKIQDGDGAPARTVLRTLSE